MNDTDPQPPSEDTPPTEAPATPTPESTPPSNTPVVDDRTPDPGAALAIAELCLLAGQPQRTAEFLAGGASQAQVRKTLLAARAEQPEIASRIAPDAGTTVRTDTSPVIAAVKKLTSQEK